MRMKKAPWWENILLAGAVACYVACYAMLGGAGKNATRSQVEWYLVCWNLSFFFVGGLCGSMTCRRMLGNQRPSITNVEINETYVLEQARPYPTYVEVEVLPPDSRHQLPRGRS